MKKTLRQLLCSLAFVVLFVIHVQAATVQQGRQVVIDSGFQIITDVNVGLHHSIQGTSVIVTGNRPGEHTMTISGITAGDQNSTRTLIVTVEPGESNINMLAPTIYTNMAHGVVSYVDVRLRNTSNILASAVTVSIPADPDFHVQLVDDPGPFTLANAERTLRFRITPRDTVVGATSVLFELNYRNAIGEQLTDTFEIPVFIQEVPDAILMVSDFFVPNNIPAGTPFSVAATIRNTSGVAASHVQVSLVDLGEGLLMQGSNLYFVGNLPAGAERVVSFELSSVRSSETGSRPIILLISDGDEIEVVQEAFVTIIGDDADTDTGRISIVSLTRPTGVFAPNQQVELTLVIRNDGDDTIDHLTIEADSATNIVPRLASSQSYQNLAVGQSASFQFAFAGTAQARTQFHDIGFTISYGEREFTQFSGFAINNPDLDEEDDSDENVVTPRVIISNYAVEPMVVMANSEFDLYLTLLNTDANRAIGNMRVTWQVPGITVPGTGNNPATTTGGATFTPVNASNTFFVDHIPARGEVIHHVRLFTIPDAAAQNHVITIEFDYYDMEGNHFTTTEEIGINVRQVSRLELEAAMIPQMVNINEVMQQGFNVLNTGRSTLRNVRVFFEGEGFNTGEAADFFGVMQGGGSEWFWGSVTAAVEGQQTLYRVATFEDELGEIHEIREAFEVYVSNPWGGVGDDDFGFETGWDDSGWDMSGNISWDEDSTEGLNLTAIGLVAVGVMAAGGVTYAIVRKKRRGPSFLTDELPDLGFAQMAATVAPQAEAAPTELLNHDKE